MTVFSQDWLHMQEQVYSIKFKKKHHLLMFWYERKRTDSHLEKKIWLTINPSKYEIPSDLASAAGISPRCPRLKCSKLLAAVFLEPCSLKLFRICSLAALAFLAVFCIAEVSLSCFDRSVATLHRRASVYTTFRPPFDFLISVFSFLNCG